MEPRSAGLSPAVGPRTVWVPLSLVLGSIRCPEDLIDTSVSPESLSVERQDCWLENKKRHKKEKGPLTFLGLISLLLPNTRNLDIINHLELYSFYEKLHIVTNEFDVSPASL